MYEFPVNDRRIVEVHEVVVRPSMIGNSGAFGHCLHIPNMFFCSWQRICLFCQCNSKSNCHRGFCRQHGVVKIVGVVT